MRSALTVVMCLSALLLGPSRAMGNGRFPNGSYVVIGPGAASDVIALRTTFGLLISRDAGAHFYWLCEDAMYYPAVVGPQVDPSLGILSDGSIHFAFEYGIHSTITGCRVDEHPEVYTQFIADLAADATGEHIVAIQANAGVANHVLRVSPSAGRYETLGRGVSGVVFTTVEVAAHDPTRVYAAGYDEGAMRAPRLFRSDDGGATLTLQSPAWGMIDDLWISGIDPTNPNTLYVRANVGFGTWLFKSTDGGAHVAHVASTTDPMLGFAISDDGRTVWIGSLNDGLLRSDDGGETFASVNRAEVLCLRQHAGVLWMCSNWQRTGYVLSRSEDRGASVRGVLRFDDVVGPYDCPMPSEGQAYCVDRWPAQREMIRTNPDASVVPDVTAIDASRVDARAPDVATAIDAGADAGVDARPMDAPDASDSSDAADAARPPTTPPPSCGICAAHPGGASGAGAAWCVALAVCAFGARRRPRGGR